MVLFAVTEITFCIIIDSNLGQLNIVLTNKLLPLQCGSNLVLNSQAISRRINKFEFSSTLTSAVAMFSLVCAVLCLIVVIILAIIYLSFDSNLTIRPMILILNYNNSIAILYYAELL